MSNPDSGFSSLVLQLIFGVTVVVGSILLVLGLGYRLWRWMTTPDEKSARKHEIPRQQLKRTVRRPASEVPIHDGFNEPVDDSDPALNSEGSRERGSHA